MNPENASIIYVITWFIIYVITLHDYANEREIDLYYIIIYYYFGSLLYNL